MMELFQQYNVKNGTIADIETRDYVEDPGQEKKK